jgi:hypothetical protein
MNKSSNPGALISQNLVHNLRKTQMVERTVKIVETIRTYI